MDRHANHEKRQYLLILAGSYKLDHIEQAYELFANQRDGVLKVAIRP